jgi:hypothetical protein
MPELGEVTLAPEAIVFDFGAANVVLRAPFQLSLQALRRLAAALAEVAGNGGPYRDKMKKSRRSLLGFACKLPVRRFFAEIRPRGMREGRAVSCDADSNSLA